MATEENEETLQQPAGHPKRRETLLQKVEEDDENDGYENRQSLVTQDEFEDLLKDPSSLYNEVIKLITRNREL